MLFIPAWGVLKGGGFCGNIRKAVKTAGRAGSAGCRRRNLHRERAELSLSGSGDQPLPEGGKDLMTKKKENSFEKIYEIVRQIPAGRVATYGQIAALAGNRRWSRVVGYALHVNPDPDGIPCFRVVNRFGEVSEAFAFGGGNRQIELLEAEGIPCPDGKVDLKKYQWERLTTDMLRTM